MQRGIEAQWDPQCKDWLNLQLAQQRDQVAAEYLTQVMQNWLNIEGAKLHFFDRFKEKQEEECKLSYREKWGHEERHNYHQPFREHVAAEVKAELMEELEPTVVAELRTYYLPSPRREAEGTAMMESAGYKTPRILHTVWASGSEHEVAKAMRAHKVPWTR